MNPSIYRSYGSNHNQQLKDLFLKDPELLGEVIDASICNDVAFDLYQLRKAAGITQEQLAIKLGVKQSNISRWETPGYKGYKVKILSKIVRALGGQLKISIHVPAPTMSNNLRFENLVKIDYSKLDIKRNSKERSFTSKEFTYASS
jgi:transcriptional regulator with XRE-family HTH domain